MVLEGWNPLNRLVYIEDNHDNRFIKSWGFLHWILVHFG